MSGNYEGIPETCFDRHSEFHRIILVKFQKQESSGKKYIGILFWWILKVIFKVWISKNKNFGKISGRVSEGYSYGFHGKIFEETNWRMNGFLSNSLEKIWGNPWKTNS